ncbi:MAG: IS3 family transposase [Smithella sp.]
MFFQVSRCGYYAYLQRKERAKEDSLVQLIRQCRGETDRTYGYRRIGLWLDRRGAHVDHKRIYRIMWEYGLFSEVRRKRKYQQMPDQLHRYSNLLNREFTANRPNEKWATDISYIGTKQGTLYLSVIRDPFDNSIVAYKTGTEQSINLVLQTIRMAQEKEAAAAELQLHSDQGFQYTSNAYFTLTRDYGITPSMSRRGNCYDNAMAENFFGIRKAECLRRHKLQSIDYPRQIIDDFVFFYNHERIQLNTKLTPLKNDVSSCNLEYSCDRGFYLCLIDGVQFRLMDAFRRLFH